MSEIRRILKRRIHSWTNVYGLSEDVGVSVRRFLLVRSGTRVVETGSSFENALLWKVWAAAVVIGLNPDIWGVNVPCETLCVGVTSVGVETLEGVLRGGHIFLTIMAPVPGKTW
jgi:hypothetical protein